MKKYILKSLFFIAIIIGIVAVSSPTLTYKGGAASKLKMMYQNDTSYDVLFVGGSHADLAYAPIELYRSTGLTSYNIATSGQPFLLTRALAEEFYEYHPYQVLVVDIYYLGVTSDSVPDEMVGFTRNVLDHMRFSKRKISLIGECSPAGQELSYYLPFLQYHSRWNELQKSDYVIDKPEQDFLLGWNPSINWIEDDGFELDVSTNQKAEIPPKSLDSLEQLMDFADENQIEVVFTALPHDYYGENTSKEWVTDQYAMFNTVEDLCVSRGFYFIQFMDILDEMNFTVKEDMYNHGHVNFFGAKKVTEYVGEYIADRQLTEPNLNELVKNEWDLRVSRYSEWAKKEIQWKINQSE